MENTTLGDMLPKEIKRCQEILIVYAEIGDAGRLAGIILRSEIDYALKAMMEGDVVNMLIAYENLKSCE